MRWPGPTDPPPTPGELIRLAREDALLSQSQLAAQAGISSSVVSRLENGVRPVSWPVFQQLLRALDLQPRVVLEPAEEHLNRLTAQEAARPASEWIYDLGSDLYGIPAMTSSYPVVIDGSLAARLHGLPLAIRDVELVVGRADCDVEELVNACARWSLWVRDRPDDDSVLLAGDERRIALRLVERTPPYVLVQPPWQPQALTRVAALTALRLTADERRLFRHAAKYLFAVGERGQEARSG